jgi:hypothetical protein
MLKEQNGNKCLADYATEYKSVKKQQLDFCDLDGELSETENFNDKFNDETVKQHRILRYRRYKLLKDPINY